MFELVGQMVAYAAVGFVVLVLGFFMIDVLTPGKLGQLVMERNVNAAVLSTATLGSLGLVMWFAIYFTGHGWNELDDVAVFGVVAVALQAVAFLVIDALTPRQPARGDRAADVAPGDRDLRRRAGGDRTDHLRLAHLASRGDRPREGAPAGGTRRAQAVTNSARRWSARSSPSSQPPRGRARRTPPADRRDRASRGRGLELLGRELGILGERARDRAPRRASDLAERGAAPRTSSCARCRSAHPLRS